ncbi:MAG: hypothetical protein BGO90_06535 [Legionella sp. 40-6]|nr:MAG: hypothetical protein BGO90_06535 [Legionella sp. 40-6]
MCLFIIIGWYGMTKHIAIVFSEDKHHDNLLSENDPIHLDLREVFPDGDIIYIDGDFNSNKHSNLDTQLMIRKENEVEKIEVHIFARGEAVANALISLKNLKVKTAHDMKINLIFYHPVLSRGLHQQKDYLDLQHAHFIKKAHITLFANEKSQVFLPKLSALTETHIDILPSRKRQDDNLTSFIKSKNEFLLVNTTESFSRMSHFYQEMLLVAKQNNEPTTQFFLNGQIQRLSRTQNTSILNEYHARLSLDVNPIPYYRCISTRVKTQQDYYHDAQISLQSWRRDNPDANVDFSELNQKCTYLLDNKKIQENDLDELAEFIDNFLLQNYVNSKEINKALGFLYISSYLKRLSEKIIDSAYGAELKCRGSLLFSHLFEKVSAAIMQGTTIEQLNQNRHVHVLKETVNFLEEYFSGGDYHELNGLVKNYLQKIKRSLHEKDPIKIALILFLSTLLGATVGAVIGFAVGFSLGIFTGPGAILSAIMGALTGAFEGILLAAAGAGALTGLTAGAILSYSLFKPGPIEKEILDYTEQLQHRNVEYDLQGSVKDNK